MSQPGGCAKCLREWLLFLAPFMLHSVKLLTRSRAAFVYSFLPDIRSTFVRRRMSTATYTRDLCSLYHCINDRTKGDTPFDYACEDKLTHQWELTTSSHTLNATD